MPGTKWLVSRKDFQTKIRGRRNISGPQGIIGSQRGSFNLGRGRSAKTSQDSTRVRELKGMISTQVGFLALKKLKSLVNAEKGQPYPRPQPPKH